MKLKPARLLSIVLASGLIIGLAPAGAYAAEAPASPLSATSVEVEVSDTLVEIENAIYSARALFYTVRVDVAAEEARLLAIEGSMWLLGTDEAALSALLELKKEVATLAAGVERRSIALESSVTNFYAAASAAGKLVATAKAKKVNVTAFEAALARARAAVESANAAADVDAQITVAKNAGAAASAKLLDLSKQSMTKATAAWKSIAAQAAKHKLNVTAIAKRVTAATTAAAKLADPTKLDAQVVIVTKATAEVNAKVKHAAARVAYQAAVKAADKAFLYAKERAFLPGERIVLNDIKLRAPKTTDTAKLLSYTKQVRELAASVGRVTAAYDKAWKTKPAWFKDARSRLSKMGGKYIPLEILYGRCGNVKAVGCASGFWGQAVGSGKIAIHKDYAKYDSRKRNWLVRHELAHQYQYAVWSKMVKSTTYKKTFRGNAESVANCMAQVKGNGVPGRNSCPTAKSKTWAQNLWKGKVTN